MVWEGVTQERGVSFEEAWCVRGMASIQFGTHIKGTESLHTGVAATNMVRLLQNL